MIRVLLLDCSKICNAVVSPSIVALDAPVNVCIRNKKTNYVACNDIINKHTSKYILSNPLGAFVCREEWTGGAITKALSAMLGNDDSEISNGNNCVDSRLLPCTSDCDTKQCF